MVAYSEIGTIRSFTKYFMPSASAIVVVIGKLLKKQFKFVEHEL
jgi:hypothetical protein